MRKYLGSYVFLFSITGIIVVLDQWTKSLVRTNLQFSQLWMPIEALEPYMRIVHWRNTGAAFGMFQSFNDLFTVLAIIVSLAIVYYFPRISSEEKMLQLALSLQLGGALGNLIDRLTQGYVTDFVSILNLPVFNVADLSITTGVIILVIVMWNKEQGGSPAPELVEEAPTGKEPLSQSLPSEDA